MPAPSSQYDLKPNHVTLEGTTKLLQQGKHSAAADNIARIKARFDEKAAALARYHDKSLQIIRDENKALSNENKGLRHALAQTTSTLENKEEVLSRLMGGSAPSPADPCELCGRLGNRYAEDLGERMFEQEPNDGSREQSSLAMVQRPRSVAAAQRTEIDKPMLGFTRYNGKDWDDARGCYVLGTKDAPHHAQITHYRKKAQERMIVDRPEPGDEDYLAQPVERESIYQTGDGRNIITGDLRDNRKGNKFPTDLAETPATASAWSEGREE
ncbi:uncharacterized protein HMPREF1541_02063 [Cyphellophora europaea CBS 101466]|uniref:Uncharacterized protein n=1 Tax=Cyphellophora europaea (strain CBS 101466) TaxID=1220924 RepID=W2S2V0_CYPE1|nr:uncharacterized protein HMPREF1541_02063 [Cyphellophora europaea CBS 101466]ETN42905.1 hypothetical protein HMPREF1541_02063 [Cyphellophora europaea CBS 101466]